MRAQQIILSVLVVVASIGGPRSAVSLEFDVPGLVGSHGCANVSVDVELPGVEGIPEQVVLRIVGEHAAGLRNSCVQDPFPEGASLYAMVEVVPGMRSAAWGCLAVDESAFDLELVFEDDLWQFDLPTVPLELWFSTHPDYTPVLCDTWFECPTVAIDSATLVVDVAVPTSDTTLSAIKAIFD